MKRLLIVLLLSLSPLALAQTISGGASGSGAMRVAVTAHSVSLTWNPSLFAIGYNAYRATVTGGPYTKINAAVDGDTTYSDNAVTSGTTYFYVVTAIGSIGPESGYSNEAVVAVPNP